MPCKHGKSHFKITSELQRYVLNIRYGFDSSSWTISQYILFCFDVFSLITNLKFLKVQFHLKKVENTATK